MALGVLFRHGDRLAQAKIIDFFIFSWYRY
ncbi:hypothetical protein M493_13995 [Geobacillus genomosp. 3]|uniref:Uncharacterized protein n=1 Tax=Geobacillus genomosp. 3 TaxID=1921421 RepID=S5Z1X9_GEOG3|nr:hypothetical protein M493_13995 [Geobacillus genomosp. 3]